MTKQKMVADVLRNLNFLVANPPLGWVEKTQKAMKAKGVEIHHNTIYDTRRREINNVNRGLVTPPPVKPVEEHERREVAEVIQKKLEDLKVAVPVHPLFADGKSVAPLTLADALAIKTFAKKFGGLDGLSNAIKSVKELIEN